jgi:deferrochelatase/peroxidase EfeB
MGFKDGTENVRAEDSEALDRFVWAQPGDVPAVFRRARARAYGLSGGLFGAVGTLLVAASPLTRWVKS